MVWYHHLVLGTFRYVSMYRLWHCVPHHARAQAPCCQRFPWKSNLESLQKWTGNLSKQFKLLAFWWSCGPRAFSKFSRDWASYFWLGQGLRAGLLDFKTGLPSFRTGLRGLGNWATRSEGWARMFRGWASVFEGWVWRFEGWAAQICDYLPVFGAKASKPSHYIAKAQKNIRKSLTGVSKGAASDTKHMQKCICLGLACVLRGFWTSGWGRPQQGKSIRRDSVNPIPFRRV